MTTVVLQNKIPFLISITVVIKNIYDRSSHFFWKGQRTAYKSSGPFMKPNSSVRFFQIPGESTWFFDCDFFHIPRTGAY